MHRSFMSVVGYKQICLKNRWKTVWKTILIWNAFGHEYWSICEFMEQISKPGPAVFWSRLPWWRTEHSRPSRKPSFGAGHSNSYASVVILDIVYLLRVTIKVSLTIDLSKVAGVLSHVIPLASVCQCSEEQDTIVCSDEVISVRTRMWKIMVLKREHV